MNNFQYGETIMVHGKTYETHPAPLMNGLWECYGCAFDNGICIMDKEVEVATEGCSGGYDGKCVIFKEVKK